MNILAEKPWSYILMEDEGRYILTLLIRRGPAEVDVSIQMSQAEANRFANDQASLKELLVDIDSNLDNYDSHRVIPPVWPKKKS